MGEAFITRRGGAGGVVIAIEDVPTPKAVLTFNGGVQSPQWNNYDPAELIIGGTASGTNPGTYTATFTPAKGYAWADKTKTAKSVSWQIKAATIANTPAQSGTLTYTGNTLTPSWSNYSTSQLTIGGTASNVNAGTFSATFTPKTGYAWADGTTAAKSVSWTIGKAAGSLSLSKTSITLDTSATSTAFTVTRAGNGTISVSSSDTSVATATLSGTTVTVKGVNNKNGVATVTVKVAAGTNHNAPANKTCSITASYASGPTLNDATWAEIRAASDSGQAANIWKVGDRKAVVLNGSAGTGSPGGSITFNNTTYYCFIMGFNHNAALEGNNRIHFGFGFKTLTGESDGNSNLGYPAFTVFQGLPMNFSDTNAGGWASSIMRTAWCMEFLNCLPADLQNVLKTVTKYTDNVGGIPGSSYNQGAGGDPASVTATEDTIFIPSAYEIGTPIAVNVNEINYQQTYEYFQGFIFGVAHNDSSRYYSYWFRSPSSYSGDTEMFAKEYFGEQMSLGTDEPAAPASAIKGFMPCFCV
jgi:hypothetical protein